MIDLACLEQLPKTGRRRENIIRFCTDLKHNYHLGGDFQIRDPETFREYEVSECEGYVIVWWNDVPVNRIVIVTIRRAPK